MRPLKIIFNTMLLSCCFMFQLQGQTGGVDLDLINELNDLLTESYDGSQIRSMKYCSITDVEQPNSRFADEYKYDLNYVTIATPVWERNRWSIDLICKSSDKCILVNGHRDVRGKDFLMKSKEVANDVYEILTYMQKACKN